MISHLLPVQDQQPFLARVNPVLRKLFLPVLTVFALLPSTALLAQTTEAEAHYQNFVDLYQQVDPSRESLQTGLTLLETANQLSPDIPKYVHGLALANGVVNNWNQAVRWLNISLSLASDEKHRQQIQIEFDYSRLQQAEQARESVNDQDSAVYSVPTQGSVDLNLVATAAMPQRLSNHAARASHDTAESILQKSLGRRHELDTLRTQSLVLITVDDGLSAASHYAAGVEDIYTYLSSYLRRELSATARTALIIMTYPQTDVLHRAARRIYPTLDLGQSTPLYGFYNPADNLIMATVEGGNYGVLIHQLVHAQLTANASELPDWFSEGLAFLYQNSRLQKDRLQPVLDKAAKSLQVESIPSLNALAEQIQSGDVRPTDANVQLLLFFLVQSDKLQNLYSLLQTSGNNFKLPEAITALTIDEAFWRRFLDLTLNSTDSAPVLSSDYKKNHVAVLFIQQALNEILNLSLAVDGLWGPATNQGLEDFQRRQKLTIDGIPGPMTMEKLTFIYGLSNFEAQLVAH